MLIANLLEKRERSIYKLIEITENSSTTVSLKELCEHLKLSKQTLLNYVTSFNEDASNKQLNIKFVINDEKLTLIKDNKLSLIKLLRFLCTYSLKYQLIKYIAYSQNHSLYDIAKHLMISEATLNRQIAALNKLLKEFAITIKNASFKGNELNIRYFLYDLLLKTTTKEEFADELDFKSAAYLIPAFEKYYQCHFSKRKKYELNLWLYISLKRASLSKISYQGIYDLMAVYQNHQFYDKLRELYLNLFSNQALSYREEEIMILFIFIFSNFFLKPIHLEKVLGFGGPIMLASFFTIKELRDDLGANLLIKEDAFYEINQLMSQFYFFKSELNYYEGQKSSYYQVALKLLTNILKSNLAYDQNYTNYLNRLYKIEALYAYFNQKEPVHIRIAFNTYKSPILAYPIFKSLKENLAKHHLTRLEYYDENKDYDLIISDYEIDKASYLISENLNSKDIDNINNIIKEILSTKSLKSQNKLHNKLFSIESR